MKKCFIVAAYVDGDISKVIGTEKNTYMICADGGYEKAIAAGFAPDLVIGDRDSSSSPRLLTSNVKWLDFPPEKDESDMLLCIRYAIEQGFDEIIVIGGIGGRLDHTISNLQTLAFFSKSKKKIAFKDEKNFVFLLENDSAVLAKTDKRYLSLLSLSDESHGVSISGVRYPLHNAILKNSYPLGLSNEFISNHAEVEVKSGRLLIVLSGD